MAINCNLLLESITTAILTLDIDGYVEYANATAIAMTGYSAEELNGQPIYMLYPNGKGDSIRMEYELNLTKTNGEFAVEGWKKRKDGSSFWAEMVLSTVYQTEFKGYICTLRDRSERKQVELELRQSEERYRLMLEGVKDYAIFMLDPTGVIVTWNEGAKKIKGYLPAEIIGKHFSIFYTSADLESNKHGREIEIAIRTGKYEEEGWRVRKNGSLFWASVVLTALYNDQNKHIGFSKVTRDLTERKESEDALKLSEERYRAIVEQVTDYGIFMMDEKGRIASWNEGAKRIKGYEAHEIIGKNFTIFYPEEDLISGKPAHELKVARAVGKYEEEGWRIKKDGTYFWANVVITAIYNKDGNLIGYSKVTRDLTERKKAEKALRESYERYRELAAELRATNTELSYANEELEQFTSIVSHDLQEPIRTIKSFLQLIELKLNQNQHTDLETYIGKSIHAANRMKELIQNLLQYSQLSKGQIIEEEVSVNELMNQALQNLKLAVEGTDARISFDSEVDTVYGDRIQLVQLIQNLVSNALKFTNAHAPEVNVRCYYENGHVKFAVSDNGIGIAETDMHKVFEIFKRLNTKKEYPGTGIGLAICKKIVDRHNGRIWPEKNEKEGTTFYFTLNEYKKEKQAV